MGPYGQWAAQAVTGGVVESLQGGSFGHGFAAAGLTAAFMPQVGGYSAPVRAALGALIGGTISAVTGGKFANGAISGAVQGVMAKRKPAPNPSQTGTLKSCRRRRGDRPSKNALSTHDPDLGIAEADDLAGADFRGLA